MFALLSLRFETTPGTRVRPPLAGKPKIVTFSPSETVPYEILTGLYSVPAGNFIRAISKPLSNCTNEAGTAGALDECDTNFRTITSLLKQMSSC